MYTSVKTIRKVAYYVIDNLTSIFSARRAATSILHYIQSTAVILFLNSSGLYAIPMRALSIA